MELKCSNFIIRPWRSGDEEALIRHADNRNISRNLRDAFPSPYTFADACWWVEHASASLADTAFAIELDGEAVGGIGLLLKDDIYRRSAEIGYWLSEQFWGRGIVTEAVRAVTEYAFSNFDLCRIYAGVFETNPGSMRVLEKAGYQFEARLKKAITKDGQTLDEMIYVIVRA
ncbi:MAG TPA: GNAT family protein [Blastocatellia bacterium]|nr:GNAT family protein [Blastocatellia bacterium]